MDIRRLSATLSVAPQITPSDMEDIAKAGFKTIINNRPDGESDDQPSSADIEAAAREKGLAYVNQPVVSGAISDADVAAFADATAGAEEPVLAFCRTGTRCTTLWALAQAGSTGADELIAAAKAAGYDLSTLKSRLQAAQPDPASGGDKAPARSFDVVVVGGGAGGISVAASLLHRKSGLKIAIIEPKDEHYYQPGWTLVGCGVFTPEQTRRRMAELIPPGVQWLQTRVTDFMPEKNQVLLEEGAPVSYGVLIVAAGNVLNWGGVAGLEETLGQNGVTSNYRYDLAPYTWELAKNLKGGTALFTQPPMPIKCAGAPQKAMYLSCDHWLKAGVINDITVEFHTAGAGIFGVKEYVPALMEYIERYGIGLKTESNLLSVYGPSKTATFMEGGDEVTREFDMLHVCPPQIAPKFIADSPLADSAGYVSVDQQTLQHPTYQNVFGLGDCCNAPNAKTAAAVRKQAPVVADNVASFLDNKPLDSLYDGYGSCPLTVEKGKIVLAEFGYGGKLLPTFPTWLIEGTRPSHLAWMLKKDLLPWIYWNGMLRGHEWLAHPDKGTPDSAKADKS